MPKNKKEEPAKSRYFTGVIYPPDALCEQFAADRDPAPLEAWYAESVHRHMRNSGHQLLVSPLHTPDTQQEVDEATGTVYTKHIKPHWHVMYAHGNTVAKKAAKKVLFAAGERVNYETGEVREVDNPLCSIIAGQYVQAVASSRNLMRYFLHLDQPEKQQFIGKEQELLTSYNGFSIDLSRQLTTTEKREMRTYLCAYMRENGVTEYNMLLELLMRDAQWEQYDFACDNYGWVAKVMDGARWGRRAAEATLAAEAAGA